MKKLYYLFFAFLSLTACQEDPLTPYEDAKPNFTGETFTPGGGGTNPAGGLVKATIAGQAWSADMIIATEMAGTITVSGTKLANNTQIGLSFDETTAVGTHNFDIFTITGAYSDNSAQPQKIYKADGPALEIISIDTSAKRVKGVFFFDAANISNTSEVIKITNGEFNVTYTSFDF